LTDLKPPRSSVRCLMQSWTRDATSGEVGRDRPWWETEPSIVDEDREGQST